MKPATVIGWHRQGFTALWRWKSRPGRPRIPRRHSAFIRRISADHPEWGEDGSPAPYPELRASAPAEGTLIALPVLGGLHYDYRLAV